VTVTFGFRFFVCALYAGAFVASNGIDLWFLCALLTGNTMVGNFGRNRGSFANNGLFVSRSRPQGNQ
jgi:hypothetical protein